MENVQKNQKTSKGREGSRDVSKRTRTSSELKLTVGRINKKTNC